MNNSSNDYNSVNLENDILFLKERFINYEEENSIVPPNSLKANSLFDKYDEKYSDNSSRHLVDINIARKLRKFVGVAASILIVVTCSLIYNKVGMRMDQGSNTETAQYDAKSDQGVADSSEVVDGYYSYDSIIEDEPLSGMSPKAALGDSMETYSSSISQLGYTIEELECSNSNTIKWGIEEVTYPNNQVDYINVIVNNKTITLGYLLSYINPVNLNSNVFAFDSKYIFSELFPTLVYSDEYINVYFIENVDDNTFGYRLSLDDYSNEELEQIGILKKDIVSNFSNHIIKK